MPRTTALAIRGATGQAATASGLTALNSTTKCAYAAWIRIPSIASTGDIMFHRLSGVSDGTIFRTTGTNALQIRTYNITTNTQLSAPVLAGTGTYWADGRWFHVLVTLSSSTGVALWYINGYQIGRSTTTVVAWTAPATATTGIGTDNSASSNVDVYDLRHWAQNDADLPLASGPACAKLCMLGMPAGESIRLLSQGPTGLDASGNARHLTWSPGSNIFGATSGPRITPQQLFAKRRRRLGRATAAAAAVFRPYYL